MFAAKSEADIFLPPLDFLINISSNKELFQVFDGL